MIHHRTVIHVEIGDAVLLVVEAVAHRMRKSDGMQMGILDIMATEDVRNGAMLEISIQTNAVLASEDIFVHEMGEIEIAVHVAVSFGK